MAYQAPETAEHHLKMAKAYLDEATDTKDSKGDANRFISEMQIKALSKAANHLDRARAVDPTAVLKVEDEKTKETIGISQDVLSSQVLLQEGYASINTARDLLSSATGRYEGVNRKELAQSLAAYKKAAVGLEKSLKYNPYSSQTLIGLTQIYEAIGDKPNYKRVVERRLELDPNDMQAHKLIEAMHERGFRIGTAFNPPFEWSTNKTLWLIAAVSFFLIPIAANSGESLKALGGIACFALVISLGALIYRWYES